ncbi:DUF3987 domain-containing protein [Algoriphagus formosus]|uniref:DUF3987 domain-containing protein n=1 Tax=Algoriphagus formosus TaxID=2007308 RepID=A0A4R5VCE2_9BACT|nr:DUF3987 domain-containing protein [Algoriphagus aquimaris]TDK49900.1 DUF3987 domain-containing protein [Algoriphagus aquimaris]
MKGPNERDVLNEIKSDILNTFSRLGPDINEVPDFPIDVFPSKLMDTIKNVSNAYGIDKSFLSSSVLFAYSLAIGNTHVIERQKNQYQKAVIYLSLVARPSSNKSAALNFALNPIQEIEWKKWKEYQDLKKEYDIWKETPRKERLIEHIDEPELVQYILIDSTMEATSAAHQINKRGLAIHRDEIVGLFKDFNKYRKGSDKENFLSNWSGLPIKITRLSREPIFISDPFISVAGTIQPAVLREISKDILKSGEGFIDRFLFVYPKKQEKALYTENEANQDLINLYKENLIKVLSLKHYQDESGKSNPIRVQFMDEGRQKVFYWLNEINKPRVDSSNDVMAGIYGKFDNYFQRICLILHFVKWSYGLTEGKEKISLETVNQAILITEFFISHTNKVQDELNQADPKVILKDHELELYNSLPDNFETSDCLEIAQKFNKKKQAFYNFLNDHPEIFKKLGQGKWGKIK